jgi:hypothetical protein
MIPPGASSRSCFSSRAGWKVGFEHADGRGWLVSVVRYDLGHCDPPVRLPRLAAA